MLKSRLMGSSWSTVKLMKIFIQPVMHICTLISSVPNNISHPTHITNCIFFSIVTILYTKIRGAYPVVEIEHAHRKMWLIC